MNIDKHIFCMEVLNRGKIATQSQSKFNCLVTKRTCKPLKHSIVKMNSISNLEERFGGHLKITTRA